ncbi:MAG TPA: hypothetical protein VFO11_13470 [Candidatus Polarisedimenticolaceae bacterium]|nr:hypothetical protein [Candidatus Polarisedimenticolaceae bacterium]
MGKRLMAVGVLVCCALTPAVGLPLAGDEPRSASPRALASADLNADGAPDLVAGYAEGPTGIVTIRLGNTDAYAPRNDTVFERLQGGYDPPSLSPDVRRVAVPEPADLLQLGDFDGDLRQDVLVAGREGDLFLLPGDGQGGLDEARRVPLEGRVTALVSGEFRAMDGRADVAVGVRGPSGPKLLLFDGADGGFSGSPLEVGLPADATEARFAMLDDDPFVDLAVAAGHQVLIVHGWGRKQEVDLASRIESIEVGSPARGLEVGFFVWNREGRDQLAVLLESGSVQVLHRGTLDETPFSEKESASRTRGTAPRSGKKIVDLEAVAAWTPEDARGWSVARERSTGRQAAAGRSMVFRRAHLSPLETDDLLLGDEESGLEVVRQKGELTSEEMRGAGSATAVLPLPQKLNGWREILVLSPQSPEPIVIPLAPTATINVDRTDDPGGASLPAVSACTAALNDCSVRGAVQFANANPGTVINLPAGTYTLTVDGAALGGCDGNATGDLALNQGTTITGAGAATTILRQHGPADRVMCMNEGFLLNLVYSFSGLTITGGRDGNAGSGGGGLGGGGIIGGEKGNALTLTNVTLSNNQSPTLGGANLGGGGIQITGGNLTVTNCLIGGTNAPGTIADRDTVANANFGQSSGGGLYFTPSAPMHTAATGVLTVSGTTFQRNTSSGIGGAGANLEIFAFAAPGGFGSGSATIGTSSFQNNAATGVAGGLAVPSLPTTVATTSFTSNSAGNRGGAIYVGGLSLTLDGGSGAVTMSGNTAPNGGSSVSTAGVVNVSGTGVTLGGDIEITSGGSWTNNVGTTLAPTNIVIVGGTFNCNNSTINVAGNLSVVNAAITGAVFNANSGTTNIQGNVSVNLANGGQFNGGTSTFNFNGSGAQAINGPSSPTFNHVAVNKGGGSTLNVNVSSLLTGSLSIASGNVDLGANTANRTALGGTLTVSNGTALRIGGTGTLPTNYSSHAIGATSTIEYYGTNQAVAVPNSAQSYGNLTISNAGTKTLAGGISVAGNLTLSGGTFDVSATNFPIGILGNWTNNGGTFNGRTGIVTFSNTVAPQSINGSAASQAFGGVTVAKTAQTLSVGGSTTSVGLGTLTLTSGTFNAGTANSINAGGDWINNGGTFTPASSVVTFNNTLAGQTIGGTAATQTFNGLAMTKTAQQLAVGGSTTSLNLNGGMTLTSGTFTAGTATSINVAGDWTNNGVGFNPGASGLVTFNGAGTQTINGSAASQTFNNVAVNKGGGSTLSVGGSTTTLNVNALTLSLGNLSAGSASTLNVLGNWTNNGGAFLPGSSVVNFNNTAAGQTIGGTAAAQGFNGISMAKTAQTLAVGGSTTALNLTGALTLTSGTFSTGTAATINVGGNWTNSGATFTPGSGLVTFSGSGAQFIGGAVASQTFNDVAVNKGGGSTLGTAGLTTTVNLRSLTLTQGTFSNGTAAVNLTGNWTNNGGSFTGGTGIVTFNGAGAQTIGGSAGTTFGAVTANNAAGVTISRDETVSGPLTLTNGVFAIAANTLTLNGNVSATLGSLSSGATGRVIYNQSSIGQPVLAANYGNLTFSDFGKVLPASGAVRIAGTFLAGPTGGHTVTGSTVELNGSAPQTLPAGFNVYNNLTINNAAGVALGGNATANGVLTLTSGDLGTTPAFTLTMPAAASSAGTTDVVGNVKRTGFVTGGNALSFGNPFTSVQIGAGTAPTDITVNLAKSVPAGFPAAVQRTYTITPNGGSGVSARVRLHYRDTELNGNTEGPGLHLFRFDGTAWQREDQQAGDTTDNWAERSGVTSFSPWTLNSTETNPQEASPGASLMLASKGAGTSVALTFTPGCGATNHTVYWGSGPISGALAWTNAACGVGNGPVANFDPGDPAPGGMLYWVIVGQTGLREGSYGQNTLLQERPEAIGVGACERPRVLTASCP